MMENFLEELKRHFEQDIKTNYIDNSKYNRGYLAFYSDTSFSSLEPV